MEWNVHCVLAAHIVFFSVLDNGDNPLVTICSCFLCSMYVFVCVAHGLVVAVITTADAIAECIWPER